MLKRWASQALSPVTLMITLLLSSLKSGAKVQLIIDIDKEKGIYLLKIRFSCNNISKRKRPCELSQSRFRMSFMNSSITILTFLLPFGSKRDKLERFNAKKESKKHPFLQGLHSLFISLMQEKRNQRVHYPQGPLHRGMQPENCRNRQFSAGFGKPGHGLILFIS